MSDNHIIVYHGNCHDGMTALWAALQRWPGAEPYEGKYGEPIDMGRFVDRDVVFVDFSCKRPQLLQIADRARSMLVLDHHATAQEDLAGLDFCVFDMERSGAGITWDYLFPGQARPPLVSYVEDRDLWNNKLESTREIGAACDSYPLTLEARDTLIHRDLGELAEEGRGILRYRERIIDGVVKYAGREVIAGFDVPSIECPVIQIVSDLGNVLAQGERFAAVFITRADGSRMYSLRSSQDGEHVGHIAAGFGGGGHAHAAGFIRPASTAV